MTRRNQKDERFDAAYQPGKLAWARKAVRDARRVALRFGMEQRELEALGRYLAAGELGEEPPDLAGIASETFEDARCQEEAERRAKPGKAGEP